MEYTKYLQTRKLPCAKSDALIVAVGFAVAANLTVSLCLEFAVSVMRVVAFEYCAHVHDCLHAALEHRIAFYRTAGKCVASQSVTCY